MSQQAINEQLTLLIGLKLLNLMTDSISFDGRDDKLIVPRLEAKLEIELPIGSSEYANSLAANLIYTYLKGEK